MSFDPRNFFPIDTDDAQRPPQLPPIASAAPLRPSPLEPSAQTDDDNLHNVKFPHRKPKSLNQAVPPPTKETSTLPAYVDPADLKNRTRMWQKLDFYQLPKPGTSSLPTATTGTAPLPPILVLNDLHQPPPSAALFPPITENEGNEQTQDAAPSKQDASETICTLKKKEDGTTVSTNWRKQKRVQARGRVHWTDQETADLLEGVKKHGLGKWKNILKDEDFHFNPRRTGIDLKDRYRTCCIVQDKAKKEALEASQPSAPSLPKETKSVPGPMVTNLPHESSGASSKASLADESVKSLKVEFENYSIKDFQSWSGRGLPNFDEKNLARFARWPVEDDSRLVRGFRKYGFKWSFMASDPEVGLGHRTSAQIRDRFRHLFPDNYRDNNNVLPRQDLIDFSEDHGFTLPPLNRDLWKTAQQPDTSGGPSSSTTRTKPPSAVHANDTTNWLQLSNQELNLDYEDARGVNVDPLDELDFGSQLAPLRYPYDQDWDDDGFDSSLQLPPMLFPPETDDASKE